MSWAESFPDILAGLMAVTIAGVALAAAFRREGWAGLALSAPALVILSAALFAARADAASAAAVASVAGLVGIATAGAAAAVGPPIARPRGSLRAVVAACVGVVVFGAVVWAAAGVRAPAPASVAAPALLLAPVLAAILAAVGLIVWAQLSRDERAAQALPKGAAAAAPAQPRHHAALRILVKALAPLAAGLGVIALAEAGPAWGLVSGAFAATAAGLYALLFGAGFALRAAPPAALLVMLASGLIAAAIAAGLGLSGAADPVWRAVATIGVAATAAGGLVVAVLSIAGRVGDLRGSQP